LIRKSGPGKESMRLLIPDKGTRASDESERFGKSFEAIHWGFLSERARRSLPDWG
jgi:hypothetical protein